MYKINSKNIQSLSDGARKYHNFGLGEHYRYKITFTKQYVREEFKGQGLLLNSVEKYEFYENVLKELTEPIPKKFWSKKNKDKYAHLEDSFSYGRKKGRSINECHDPNFIKKYLFENRKDEDEVRKIFYHSYYCNHGKFDMKWYMNRKEIVESKLRR